MGANASITFPKSLAIQVFWLIGRILSKINCKTQTNSIGALSGFLQYSIQGVSAFSSLSLRRLISVPFSSAPMMRAMALRFSQISRTMTVPMEPYSRE